MIIDRFPFDDLSAVEYDAIMYNRWTDAQLKKEPNFFQTKWFDVRHMHITQATYLFAHLFTKLTRECIRKHINPSPPVSKLTGKTKDWEPLKGGDFFEPPTSGGEKRFKQWKIKVKALITARQIADQYGIPYDFFIARGLRHWYFGRSYFLSGSDQSRALPSPSMLKNDDCLAAIAESWLTELSARIHHGEHPRYLVKNNYGQLDAEEHQRFICEQIKRKSDPIPALKKFFDLGFLGVPIATELFGEDRVALALSR